MLRQRLLICLATLLFYFPAEAQSDLTSDSVDVFIKNKMQQLYIPALQVAIVRGGKMIKLSSYGIANLENSIPATDESLFSINSCTKSFVGVAIMRSFRRTANSTSMIRSQNIWIAYLKPGKK
ncbi:serine hydrolase [Pedobacter sp. NJ-S-72]